MGWGGSTIQVISHHGSNFFGIGSVHPTFKYIYVMCVKFISYKWNIYCEKKTFKMLAIFLFILFINQALFVFNVHTIVYGVDWY